MKQMPFILLLLLVTAGYHCRKNEVAPPVCYECRMTYSTGAAAGIQYPCTTDIAQWQKEQQDTNGNPITSECAVR